MLPRPFTGVIAAPLLPMHEGGAIDWATLERYMTGSRARSRPPS